MTPYVKTEAIILKSFKINEADRLVVFFTPQWGKRNGVVRAIRKGKNKFRGNIEPGYIVQLMLYLKNPHKDITSIIGLETLTPFNTNHSWHKMLTLNYILDLLDEAFPLHDVHEDMYQFVSIKLRELQNIDDKEIAYFLRIFELILLDTLGISHNIDVCSICGSPIKTKCVVNMTSLTTKCNHCQSYLDAEDIVLESDFFFFYKSVLSKQKSDIFNAKIDRQSKLFFKKVFSTYLGRHMRSLQILESLPW